MGWKDNETIVLHAGAISLRQGLENVVEAARYAADISPHLRFVLMGHGSQRARLEDLGVDLPNLSFVDGQPADRFPNVLAAADVLLVNERGSVENMSLPSKLTSYFMAGRPVVVAANPNGATAREAIRSGAAIVAPPEDPESLVTTITSLVRDSPMCDRLSTAGPSYAQEHLNAETALARATRFVETLLKEPRSDE
jgi:glycosyltransferase involved in cell wall biosynthesis